MTAPPAMKSGDGEHVLHALSGLPQPRRAVAFVRHAERSKSPSGHPADFEGSSLLLTDNGHAAARRFGSRLPRDRSLRIYHSPSRRAIETAGDVLEGFKAVGEPPPSGIAGVEPLLSTFYGSTVDEAGRLNLKRDLGGGQSLLRAWIDGRVPLDILRPVTEARENRLNMLRTKLLEAPTGSMTLMISHDFTIILLRDWLFGVRFEQTEWPAYLDGVVISEDEYGGLNAAWQNHVVAVPIGEANA